MNLIVNLIVISLCFVCTSALAQTEEVGFSVYGETGGLAFPCLGCEGGGADVIFSLQAAGEVNRKRNATATRFALGIMRRDEEWYLKTAITGVWLSGKGKKSHFEIDYGAMLTAATDPAFLPILNLGYRFQDLNNPGPVFRMGLGLEFIGPYLSYGFSF